jgi:hypothetical protein
MFVCLRTKGIGIMKQSAYCKPISKSSICCLKPAVTIFHPWWVRINVAARAQKHQAQRLQVKRSIRGCFSWVLLVWKKVLTSRNVSNYCGILFAEAIFLKKGEWYFICKKLYCNKILFVKWKSRTWLSAHRYQTDSFRSNWCNCCGIAINGFW